MATSMVLSESGSSHRSQGMLWVEVTNGCNLNCSHCYSDSFPGSNRRDTLSHVDYARVVDEAAAAGVSTIQFIGGEPLLYKRLPELIRQAQALKFERVEVFSNLSVNRPDVLDAIDPAVTTIATSVYSDDARIHDQITRKLGSFSRTIEGVRAVAARSIVIRAGFIEMDSNRGHYDRAAKLMFDLGVGSVGFDRVREFGRAEQEGCSKLGDLCGSCAGNTLCVTYDGTVLPCIMSRDWPIGNIKESSLYDVALSDLAARTRRAIHEATRHKQSAPAHTDSDIMIMDCTPNACAPTQPDCLPRCQPGCYPGQGCTPCGPQGSNPCYPNQRCNPIGCGIRF